MVDKNIQKCVCVYFSVFENHVKKWSDIVDRLKRPLVGLKNQSEQLVHVERVNFGGDLLQFPDLREKLLFKILSGIDDELLTIKNSINELSALNQELRNKLVVFEKSTSDFDFYNDDISSGNAFQPRLSDLLQMGLESWTYYSEIYQCTASNFKLLDVRNSMSIKKLEDSFVIKNDVRERIDYILAITQYCNKNN